MNIDAAKIPLNALLLPALTSVPGLQIFSKERGKNTTRAVDEFCGRLLH